MKRTALNPLVDHIEGVEVSESGAPVKYKVSLARYGWCEIMWRVLRLVFC